MNKKIFRIFTVLLFLGFTTLLIGAPGQNGDAARQVTEALNKGNARDVAQHFGSTVDLKLPGNEGTYSRNQAELILRNFFSANSAGSFSLQHQGKPSRDGSVYVIGTYIAKNGTSFRTYFLLKKISDKMVLHLLQMEEQ
ncbi:MAG: DUF4783 domain-containing protein [Bacteroidota bacterium]